MSYSQANIFSLAIFISAGLLLNAQSVISEVNFAGLSKTNISYVENFIQTKAGDEFDSLIVLEDEQALWNLQLFSSVNCEIEVEEQNVIVTFFLKERITILPIINFGSIMDNIWYQIGAADFNFLGNGTQIGGYYKYYDRHSFEIFQITPYLFGTRFGVRNRLGRFSTLEPAYFGNTVTFYNVDRYSIELIARYDFTALLGRGVNYSLETGGEYLYEEYNKNLSESLETSPGPLLDKHNKLLIKTSFTIQELNYFYQFIEGFSNRIFYEVVSETGDAMGFFKLLDELRGYYKIGESLNLAGRIRLGLSTNKNSPFIPFVIDSYINVRGVGDRVARGSAELTLNLEMRQTLFNNDWLAVEGIGFFDRASLRAGGEDIDKLFSSENSFTYFGAGLRVHLFSFYGSVLRLDYGFNIENLNKGGFVLGLGQYF